MKQRAVRAGKVATAAGLALGLGFMAQPALADDDEDYEVLIVGRTMGFRHGHIPITTDAIIDLGAENGFTVDVWDPQQPDLTLDSTPFTSTEDLAKYATIIFVSPVDGTNRSGPEAPRLLNDDELAAFQGYIRGGGAFTGIHAATDTMHAIPWFSQLTGGGARFVSHPQNQQATMVVENGTHPSTVGLPTEWSRFDEWYNYTVNPREDVHVLMTLDESTYNAGNGRMGEDHPIAWCHNFEGARSWYTGAGHTDASWQDPAWLGHVLGGIEWSAGKVSGGGDCVTFPEVAGILDAAEDVDAALAAQFSGLLAAAQRAADAGDHDGALASLLQAAELTSELGVEGLDGKVDDLIVWQRARSATGGPDDADGIPVDVTIPDRPGALTLSVADYGDGVQLIEDDGPTDRWRYTGQLPTVTITDSRTAEQAGDSGWAASGRSSSFTSGEDEIAAENFGWIPRVLTERAGLSAGERAHTVLEGGTGLSGPALLAEATTAGRQGNASATALLVLDAPIGTAGGDYSAQVTVSLFPVD